ncbi:MAG: hypothetical protein OZ921_20310, partial [Sorangiineae bacterium]|nr:hypothetical protein [Sorangiineae bacterium]
MDSAALLEVARAAGEALGLAGEVPRAIEIYRAALAFEPASSELLARVDELLAQQGSPGERLALYETALAQATEPVRRRELLHATAALRRRELDDLPGAIAIWRAVLAEDPDDFAAHQALVQALGERGERDALRAELERALGRAEGERRDALRARLAEALADDGEVAGALEHYRALLEHAELDDEVLARIERLARAHGDAPSLEQVLARRLARTDAPALRAELLEEYGDVIAAAGGPDERATRAWLEGARAALGVEERERAERLYERVRAVAPSEREAPEALFELAAQSGRWARAAELFAALAPLVEPRDAASLLDGVEPAALAAGAIEAVVDMLDALATDPRVEPARGRELSLRRARALAANPARRDDAAAAFRQLIEAPGELAAAALEGFGAFLASAPERVADRRWLHERRVARAADPIGALIDWAGLEERELGAPGAALGLYRRAFELDAERADVLAEIARLEEQTGDLEAALASLEALRDRSEGEARLAAEVSRAGLLLGALGRPLDALDVLEPLIEAAPGDAALLRLAHEALGQQASRARAAALLERAAGAADDPAARARVLEALLEVSGATPELSGARVRWMKQLLEVRADAPREALALALRGALEAPAEGALWDAAERFARELDEPAPVAEAFARALERPMPPEATDELARRMIDFQEEWFDDPARVVELLGRVVELSPHADWAFDRLKLAYNAAGRWSELFALYDRALERSADERVRVELLREAAMAAKDFAADTERAIDYLERLERASPGDPRVDAALERLYERDGRYRPLIELLSRRLGGMGDAAGGELRERIAALWLELGEALPAFELLASGEAGGEASPVAVELLERLVALPASRDTVAPTSGGKRRKRNYSVRDRVAARLREHYAAVGRTADKARMLEIELEVAQNDQDRIRRLEELVTLRLDELGDEAGAFDNLAALVRLDPENRDFRARLAELARRTDDYRRYAELLTLVARGTDARALRLSLLAEAAPVVERELGDRPAAIRLYSEVLELAAKEPAEALSAARALDGLLLAAGDSAARASVLERRAELEEERELRRAALGEVARIAAEELGELDRAISAWRARLADDAADGPALDGLCRTLEAARRWPELVQALTERAARAQARSLARADRVRVAAVQAGELGKPGAAIDTWRGLRAEWGADDESFEALVGLFGRTARWDDLAELLASEAEGSLDAERRRALFERLGALHRDERGDVGAAIDAFVAAGNWERAAHVASSVGERGAARAALERVLDRAVAAWSPAPVAPSEVAPSGPGGLPETVAGAAGWALGELITRLTEEGRLADVVELELRGASLPFSVKRRRELARDAALLSADRLSAPERAIEIFTALFAEEPADEVASGSARRFVTLLEEQGRYEDVVSLWERQAECRERAGDAMGAASLWARAAALAEERLGDVERSVADHLRGAGLGGETSLEALARHHHAAGRAREEAEVLEWLAAQSSAEALAPRALALAEAYVAANSRKRARARLEEYAKVALDAAALRERLAGLYREMGDYTALALLLAAEADRAPDAPSRLALLREAARLHLERRDDPGAAVPLLEKAMELAGDGSELPLALSDALRRAARFDQAVAILREQIARYGARKPKERAVVHFALSQVWLESGSRAEALAELDLASRIDQAHPGILRALAALALEEGELERAERMYRALLLVLGRGARDDGPSRVEALLDLGRIAETKGDAVRAVEFVESAFEAALESVAEARTLEAALRRRGRRELLGRALEARLSGELEPRDAAQVLAELAALHAEQGGDQSDAKRALARRVGEVERQLGAEPGAGDEAWAALGRCYAWLGDAEAETRALERRVAGWSRDEDARPEPEVLHRLAAIKLGSAETREAGAELLERALELTGELGQAEELILAAVEAEPENERLARLLERVGRAPGRERLLLRALTLLVAFPAARAAAAREGADLARGLGGPARA